MSARERRAIVVEVLVLMLVRVVEGQIGIGVYALLHGRVVAMIGNIMMSTSALTSLSMAVDWVGGLVDDVPVRRWRDMFGTDVLWIRGGHSCLMSLLVSLVKVLGQHSGAKEGQGNECNRNKSDKCDQPWRHCGEARGILLYSNTRTPRLPEHQRAQWLSVESRQRGCSSEQGLDPASADASIRLGGGDVCLRVEIQDSKMQREVRWTARKFLEWTSH